MEGRDTASLLEPACRCLGQMFPPAMPDSPSSKGIRGEKLCCWGQNLGLEVKQDLNPALKMITMDTVFTHSEPSFTSKLGVIMTTLQITNSNNARAVSGIHMDLTENSNYTYTSY